MEGTDWYNRTGYTDYRNHYRGDERPLDEDVYRGAYRFDISSDHRNVSTWDWRRPSAPEHKQVPGNRYSQDYNRNYNRDYNRNYNRDYNRDYGTVNRRAGELAPHRDHEREWSEHYHNDRGGYDHDNYNTDSRYRDTGQGYRTSNTSNWNRQQKGGHVTHNQPIHRSVHNRMVDHDPYGTSNFNADYGPDHFGYGGGENYGNMAGSLSYGYDGTSNYDPDWNREYDPLSGHRHSYHGHYTSRHPESYLNQQNRPDASKDRRR